MAVEIHSFAVTIPPATLSSAPLLTPLDMPARVVTDIEVVVPAGPRGNVGFAIGYGGNPVLPYEPGSFFVTDDETIHWPVEGHITSGAWQCFAYNTGQFPHTLHIRFLCELPVDPRANASPLAPLSQLQPAS